MRCHMFRPKAEGRYPGIIFYVRAQRHALAVRARRAHRARATPRLTLVACAARARRPAPHAARPLFHRAKFSR